ncbi:MAG: ComEC/Rec2 family competence protein [Synergistaceae bacterium]|nr:ComEC/Rec2 family competence protein [Synergistaceae bacterium]
MLVGGWHFTDNRAKIFIFILFLSFLFSFYSLSQIHKKNVFPSTVETSGKIVLNRQWGRLRAVLIDTKYGKLVTYIHSDKAPNEGSYVNIRGALFDFKNAKQNNKGFDENLFWRSNNAVKKIVILDIVVTSLPRGIYRWRNYLRELIDDKLPPNMAAYMLALTVGEKDKTLSEIHRKAGTIHLLAVSGFHIGLLAAIGTYFFRRGKKKIIGITILIWGAILLVGMPPGGVRAALMVQVYLLGLLLGKPSYAFNSVSVAGILMLLFNPWIFYSIGWRLSITAALFLSAIIDIDWHVVLKACVASLLVWFVTAPLVACAFQEVPIVGLAINIIAVPLFALLFPLIILFAFPLLIGLPFSEVLVAPIEYILEAWNIFSNLITYLLPWSVYSTMTLVFSSLFIFICASAYASGIPMKRIPYIAAIFSSSVLFLV